MYSTTNTDYFIHKDRKHIANRWRLKSSDKGHNYLIVMVRYHTLWKLNTRSWATTQFEAFLLVHVQHFFSWILKKTFHQSLTMKWHSLHRLLKEPKHQQRWHGFSSEYAMFCTWGELCTGCQPYGMGQEQHLNLKMDMDGWMEALLKQVCLALPDDN